MTQLHPKILNYFWKYYSKLCHSIGWSKDDLASELYIMCTEADPQITTYSTYAISVLRNKLIDRARRLTRRYDGPCYNCPLDAYRRGSCTRYKDQMRCELFAAFEARESARQSIFVQKSDKIEVGAAAPNLQVADMIEFCLATLDEYYLELFLNYLNNGALQEPYFSRLIAHIREKLDEEGWENIE